MMFGSEEGMGILIPPPPPPQAAMGRSREERVPLWGLQETKDFIAIRGELEKDFTVSKRNKNLWEVVASRMVERGYKRTPDQCKCKWKNLVNRYKVTETSDPEHIRQCPFFEELHTVFAERRLIKSETDSPNTSKKRTKRTGGDKSSEEFSDEEEDEDNAIDEKQSAARMKKKNAEKVQRRAANKSKAAVHRLLQEFFQQQQCSEGRWMEMMERRALERQIFELEWRQSMEKLERERMMLEQAWQEREDQRRVREESRTAKRDALLSTILNKLIHGDL